MGTNYNWYNRHFHVLQLFFNSPVRSRYLSLFSHSRNFTLRSAGTAKSTIQHVLVFLLIIIRFGRLDEIRQSVCISKSPRSFCILFSWTDSGLHIYHLFAWSNFNFLHNYQWITQLNQSCLVLCDFWVNLLHWLIMLLIVSSLSSHKLQLLFCCALYILAFIWLVLMALFCAAIRRDSVFLLRFPFLGHVQVFLCEMSHVSRLKCP